MGTHRKIDHETAPEALRRLWDIEDEIKWVRIEQLREAEEFTIRADLPGIDPERDLEVTISDHVLHIAAERRPRVEPEARHDHTYRCELHYGSFERDIHLPEGAREDDVRASYHQGVLEIALDVPEAEKCTVTVVPVAFT